MRRAPGLPRSRGRGGPSGLWRRTHTPGSGTCRSRAPRGSHRRTGSSSTSPSSNGSPGLWRTGSGTRDSRPRRGRRVPRSMPVRRVRPAPAVAAGRRHPSTVRIHPGGRGTAGWHRGSRNTGCAGPRQASPASLGEARAGLAGLGVPVRVVVLGLEIGKRLEGRRGEAGLERQGLVRGDETVAPEQRHEPGKAGRGMTTRRDRGTGTAAPQGPAGCVGTCGGADRSPFQPRCLLEPLLEGQRHLRLKVARALVVVSEGAAPRRRPGTRRRCASARPPADPT
jgi:hypothetical protein